MGCITAGLGDLLVFSFPRPWLVFCGVISVASKLLACGLLWNFWVSLSGALVIHQKNNLREPLICPCLILLEKIFLSSESFSRISVHSLAFDLGLMQCNITFGLSLFFQLGLFCIPAALFLSVCLFDFTLYYISDMYSNTSKEAKCHEMGTGHKHP